MSYPEKCAQKAQPVCTKYADGYYWHSSSEMGGICRACHKLCTNEDSQFRYLWRSYRFIWYDSEQHYQELKNRKA